MADVERTEIAKVATDESQFASITMQFRVGKDRRYNMSHHDEVSGI